MENLIQYGLTRVTLEHWARQVITMLGVVVTVLYLSTLFWAVVVQHSLHLQLVWVALTFVFVAERAITVRQRGWKMSVLASFLIFEMPFDLFLQAVHLKAYWQALSGTERSW